MRAAHVAANRINTPSIDGVYEHDPRGQCSCSKEHYRYRYSKECSLAQKLKTRTQIRNGHSLAVDKSEPTHRAQHAERNDERRQSNPRNENATASPGDYAHRQGSQDGEERKVGLAPYGQAGADHASERQDGTDGKIDSAGQNHERHPDSEYAVDRNLAQDVRQIAASEKVVAQTAQREHDEPQGYHDSIARE